MRSAGAAPLAKLLRIVAAVLALAATALVAAPVASGQSTTTELGSYGLRAGAHGARIDLGSDIAGTVPDAAAQLDTGGIAYGRSSIAWPGPVAANAGDLIILASGGQIPPEMEPTFRMLNYPLRAEARAPGGPLEASHDGVPGASMTADASPAHAAARTAVQGAEISGLGTLGSVTTGVRTSLEEDLGRSVSESIVSDVEIADGLIRIEAVHSRAETTSNGVIATATAATTVSGVTVAGTPATLDETGLHIGADGGSVPVNEAANELAGQVFRESGMVVFVTDSTTEDDGPSASAVAGSVLIALSEDGPFIVFGGASASSVAGEAFPITVPDVVAGPTGDPVALPTPTEARARPLTAARPASAESPPEPVASRTGPILSGTTTALPDADFAGVLAIGSALALLASRSMRRLAACVDDPTASCPLQGVP